MCWCKDPTQQSSSPAGDSWASHPSLWLCAPQEGMALSSLAPPTSRAHTDSLWGACCTGQQTGLLSPCFSKVWPWFVSTGAALQLGEPHGLHDLCTDKSTHIESYNSTYRLLWKLSLKQARITQQIQQYSCAEMFKDFYATSLIRRGILGWKWNLCRKRLVLINFSTWKSVQIVNMFHFDISKHTEKERKRRKSSFKSLFILR